MIGILHALFFCFIDTRAFLHTFDIADWGYQGRRFLDGLFLLSLGQKSLLCCGVQTLSLEFFGV